MKYSVDKQEKYTVISLQEENLNAIVAPDLKSEFVVMSNEGVPNLILDLSDAGTVWFMQKLDCNNIIKRSGEIGAVEDILLGLLNTSKPFNSSF